MSVCRAAMPSLTVMLQQTTNTGCRHAVDFRQKAERNDGGEGDSKQQSADQDIVSPSFTVECHG